MKQYKLIEPLTTKEIMKALNANGIVFAEFIVNAVNPDKFELVPEVPEPLKSKSDVPEENAIVFQVLKTTWYERLWRLVSGPFYYLATGKFKI